MPTAPHVPFHGSRRFHNVVEGRYYRYTRPEVLWAICTRCQSPLTFFVKPIPATTFDEASGGWLVHRGDVCGTIAGRGGCAKCGNIAHSVQWPEAAYLKVTVPEGIVWAWNDTYLPALLARVRGDKVGLRRLTLRDWNLARFVARLPKFAVVTKNRARILDGMSKLRPLSAATPGMTS